VACSNSDTSVVMNLFRHFRTPGRDDQLDARPVHKQDSKVKSKAVPSTPCRRQEEV
jgi:hypothetical protein